jgi:putative ABC transport system ATP-binding protein
MTGTRVAFDLPGFGYSDAPTVGSIAGYTRDIADGISMLGVERFTLIGHSLGGAAATALAEQMPDRVAALVLLAPAGFGRIHLAEAVSLPGVRNLVEAALPIALSSRLAVTTAYLTVVANGKPPERELVERVTSRGGALVDGAREGTRAVVDAGRSPQAFHRRNVEYGGPVFAVWGDRDRLRAGGPPSRCPSRLPRRADRHLAGDGASRPARAPRGADRAYRAGRRDRLGTLGLTRPAGEVRHTTSKMSALRDRRAARHEARRRATARPLRGHDGGADVVVEELCKSFGPIDALRGVSLTVAASEFVTITGPSGSGKSTLLNLIGSVDRPDAGMITVAGEPVPEPGHAVQFRRHVVGFVFQDNLLLPYLSAQGNIEAALLATGLGRRQRREQSSQLLAEVGLADRARHLPSELSGGQRQAVALARALANHPRLLLADEPTGALDSASASRALDLLAALRQRHGMTLIVVSHDAAVADRADRVLHLVDGRIVSISSDGERGRRAHPGDPPDRIGRADHADRDSDQDRAAEPPGGEGGGNERAEAERAR